MYILSGTLYIIASFIILILVYLWNYSNIMYYLPLMIVAALFLIAGIVCYVMEYVMYKKSK